MEELDQEDSAGEREGDGEQDVGSLLCRAVSAIEQDVDDQQDDGDDHLQASARADLVFVLAAPLDIVAGTAF